MYNIGDKVKIKKPTNYFCGDDIPSQFIRHGSASLNEGVIMHIHNEYYIVDTTRVRIGYKEDNLELLVPVQQSYPIY